MKALRHRFRTTSSLLVLVNADSSAYSYVRRCENPSRKRETKFLGLRDITS